MPRTLSITLIIMSMLYLHCASWTISAQNITRELQASAESIKKDRSLVYTLDQKKIGATGYFYIMRNDGVILYHPKKALINFSFSEYAFAKKILKEKNGCLTSTADRITRYIFYCEIDKNEILCLTIDSNEVDETSLDCSSTDN